MLALRHQLAVLQRAAPKRPRLRSLDRLLWVLPSIVWPNWRQAVQIVTPATVVRWHRRAFAAYWRWNSRSRRIGRPALASDLRILIRRMREANPTLGSAPHPPRARSPRGANRKTIRVTLQAAAKSPMTAGWRFESLHEWPSIISSSGVHRPMRRYARRRFPRAEPFGDARGLGRNTMRARRLPKLPVRSFTDAPHPRAVQRITDGPAVEIPAVGGLHHRYERQCGVIRLPRETRHSGAAPHKHHRRSGFPCRPRACSVSATTLTSFSITRRRGAEPVELRSLTLRRILAGTPY